MALWRGLPLAVALGLVACSSSTGGDAGGAGGGGGVDAGVSDAADDAVVEGGVESLFVAPASLDELAQETFFDHPWPSDARLDPDGTPHFQGWPNPRFVDIIDQYAEVVDTRVDGFSPVAAGYLRFTGSLDPATLPADPQASLAAGASVQLLDLGAPTADAMRQSLQLLYRDEAGVYWQPHTLAFSAAFGVPLRPARRYALVVTSRVHGKDGAPVRASATLRQVLGLDAAGAGATRVRAAWGDALDAIGRAGIAASDIAHLTVFKTADPTAELFAVRDDLRAHFAAPTAHSDAWLAKEKTTEYAAYEGVYGPSPDYQQGTVPFATFGSGGDFAFVGGAPAMQRSFDLRFALVVPDATACPLPAAGYPIVLYAHGTGGDYRSFVRDGTAKALAGQCLASMGIDQIFHGTRPGAPQPGTGVNVTQEEELLFFNFQNAPAARTNGRQAAIDEVQRARLFTESHLEVPAAVAGGAAIRFDGTKVLFFGHSQGGLNGPLFLAIDDGARGGVLSGSGSMIEISLLEKTQPSPSVANVVKRIFLALRPDEDAELGPMSPPIALAQSLVDATDPIHYVRHLFTEPRAGMAPKSIYQTEGVEADGSGDHYTPPHSIEVQALATGLPLQAPAIHAIAEAVWAGPPQVTVPAGGLSGNLAGGLASGVLAQWHANDARDGHFVVFDIAAARAQAAGFCRALADDPHGKVPAP